MLGRELETYEGNKFAMACVGVLVLGAAALAASAFVATPRDNASVITSIILLALPGVWLAWFISLRVTLHANGITYHSLFGETEMLWEKVERFRYRATKQSYHLIPLGTSYHFHLSDSEGNRIRLGGRIDRPDRLAEKLVELTTPELQKKIFKRFDQDEDLNFGVIKVNRKTGIKIRKFFHYREIPWNQVTNCAMEKGRFYIWRTGEKRTTGSPVHLVVNAFVLLALLKLILRLENEAARVE